jgi:hypothetical protein
MAAFTIYPVSPILDHLATKSEPLSAWAGQQGGTVSTDQTTRLAEEGRP